MTGSELGRKWAGQQGRAPIFVSAEAAIRLGRVPPIGAPNCWVWLGLPDFFSCRNNAYESLDDAFSGLGRAVGELLRVAELR